MNKQSGVNTALEEVKRHPVRQFVVDLNNRIATTLNREHVDGVSRDVLEILNRILLSYLNATSTRGNRN